MTVHSLGEYRRKRGGALEPANLGESPIGTFTVRRTRDANALARDGEPVYGMNEVRGSSPEESLIEIQFGDGEWILVDPDELSFLDD